VAHLADEQVVDAAAVEVANEGGGMASMGVDRATLG
jgi:hypothetical protein